MNISNKFASAVGLALLGGTFSAGAAVLDSFDSFGSPLATTGFSQTFTGAGPGAVATDTDTLPSSDRDASFTSLQRRVALVGGSGTGTMLANNSATAGVFTYGNTAKQSTATLTYTFPAGIFSAPAGINLSSYAQIDFSFLTVGSGISVLAEASSATFGEGLLTGNFSIPASGTPSLFSVSVSSLTTGNPAVWDSVRYVRFTFSNDAQNLDSGFQLTSIDLNVANANVPEAKTTIPMVAFAAGLGFVAWRRRSSK